MDVGVMPPSPKDIAEWKSRFPCPRTRELGQGNALYCLLMFGHEDECEFTRTNEGQNPQLETGGSGLVGVL